MDRTFYVKNIYSQSPAIGLDVDSNLFLLPGFDCSKSSRNLISTSVCGALALIREPFNCVSFSWVPPRNMMILEESVDDVDVLVVVVVLGLGVSDEDTFFLPSFLESFLEYFLLFF